MVNVASAISGDQHLTLNGVSWHYYEKTLQLATGQPLRLNFLDGTLEIMSPLPEHEAAKVAICGLIDLLTFVIRKPRKSFGSTTFRREDCSAGAEPDACYYFTNINKVQGMKGFEPALHPAPDLVIEIDLFSVSVPRESIFARLGVKELWRYRDGQLQVRQLNSDSVYADQQTSQFFSFLPMYQFTSFVQRMMTEDEISVLSEFREWVLSIYNG